MGIRTGTEARQEGAHCCRQGHTCGSKAATLAIPTVPLPAGTQASDHPAEPRAPHLCKSGDDSISLSGLCEDEPGAHLKHCLPREKAQRTQLVGMCGKHIMTTGDRQKETCEVPGEGTGTAGHAQMQLTSLCSLWLGGQWRRIGCRNRLPFICSF